MVRIEALNHAIRGLPQDRIRFHLCRGSWHGPHTTDIPMHDIVDVMLAVKCQADPFEAGNVRHEHEWTVWEDVKLPDGKILLPGVVSHATNVVEHPELVAQRILRFTKSVGRERVIAATDCGLGGRVHPMVAWAKLEALAQGAALASKQLWRSAASNGRRMPAILRVPRSQVPRFPELRHHQLCGVALRFHPRLNFAFGLALAEAVTRLQAFGQFFAAAADAGEIFVGDLDPVTPNVGFE